MLNGREDCELKLCEVVDVVKLEVVMDRIGVTGLGRLDELNRPDGPDETGCEVAPIRVGLEDEGGRLILIGGEEVTLATSCKVPEVELGLLEMKEVGKLELAELDVLELCDAEKKELVELDNVELKLEEVLRTELLEDGTTVELELEEGIVVAN
jgi:hypothetical protein